MKTSNTAVLLALAAVIACMPSLAADHRKVIRTGHRGASGMQVIASGATNGQPGDGWQYFSDVR